MRKKVFSIFLLCILFILLIPLIRLFVTLGVTLFQAENMEIDTTKENLPGASILVLLYTAFALLFGSIFVGGTTSSIGFFCSLINIKIAPNNVIRRISKAFLVFYSIVLLSSFFAFIVLVSRFFMSFA